MNSVASVAVPAAASAPALAAAPVASPRVSLASLDGASNVVVLRTASHEAVRKAALAADGAPFAVPDSLCPRCASPRAAADACPQCGVRFEGFDDALALPPRWLRDEWVALLRDWGNDAHHVQLRRKAQQLDALAEVGRLYRLRLAAAPDDPIAAEGRQDVLRLAAVAMTLTPGDDGVAQRKRAAWLIGGGLVAALLLLMTALLLWR